MLCGVKLYHNHGQTSVAITSYYADGSAMQREKGETERREKLALLMTQTPTCLLPHIYIHQGLQKTHQRDYRA